MSGDTNLGSSSTHLYVLSPSHFCERARWGLDVASRPYVLKAWMPGVHVPLARRIAKASTLPILVSRGEVVQGSGAILDWAGLNATDKPLEDRFDTRIGPLVSRYLYSGLLHDARSGVRDVLLHDVPRWQAVIGRTAWPILRRAMIAGMGVQAAQRPRLEQALSDEVDWVDAIVEQRTRLGGERFGRSDITAASLLAPLARPHALPLYRQVRMPLAVERMLQQWSERPSLRWVLRTYAEHRH